MLQNTLMKKYFCKIWVKSTSNPLHQHTPKQNVGHGYTAMYHYVQWCLLKYGIYPLESIWSGNAPLVCFYPLHFWYTTCDIAWEPPTWALSFYVSYWLLGYKKRKEAPDGLLCKCSQLYMGNVTNGNIICLTFDVEKLLPRTLAATL